MHSHSDPAVVVLLCCCILLTSSMLGFVEYILCRNSSIIHLIYAQFQSHISGLRLSIHPSRPNGSLYTVGFTRTVRHGHHDTFTCALISKSQSTFVYIQCCHSCHQQAQQQPFFAQLARKAFTSEYSQEAQDNSLERLQYLREG